MPQLGPLELVLILVAVVIIFGVGKLPEVGGAVGKSIKEFRKASKDGEAEEAAKDAAAPVKAEATASAAAAPAASTTTETKS